MKKVGNNLPQLIKQKLSKKEKERYDKIKLNLHTANRNWNDWKFQIYWNMIEWVNPRGKILRKEPYSTSSKKTTLNKII